MGKRGNAEWPDEKIIAAKLELRKLLDQRSNPEWPNWAEEIRAVRLELRNSAPVVPRCNALYRRRAAGDYDLPLPPRSSEKSFQGGSCPTSSRLSQCTRPRLGAIGLFQEGGRRRLALG